jgi:site-specific recombinase XerD
MTIEEVNAIMSVPNPTKLIGIRDKALVSLLYNSGARVQEVADLRICDIRFEAPATVTLTGKGNKTRVIPLRKETTEILSIYLDFRKKSGIKSDHLFLNVKGDPMTRFGIGRRVGQLAVEAARHCPSLKGRTITPHVFRHTVALHLIESDVDIVLVQEWLGHADLKTTSLYVEVSVERKRAALEKVPPPENGADVEVARWKQPAIMEFLTNLSRGVMLRKPVCSA